MTGSEDFRAGRDPDYGNDPGDENDYELRARRLSGLPGGALPLPELDLRIQRREAMDRIDKVLATIPDDQNTTAYTDTKGKEGFRNPVRPVVGEGLTALVEKLGIKTTVELGTALGRSGLHMAKGGLEKLATVEFDKDAADQARANFKAADLPGFIVHNMDSGEFTEQWHHPIDMLFVDHAKDRYLGDLQALEPHLNPKALVLLDNMYNRADALQECAGYVAGNYYSAIFMEPPTGKDGVTTGLMVASKDRETFERAMDVLYEARGQVGA